MIPTRPWRSRSGGLETVASCSSLIWPKHQWSRHKLQQQVWAIRIFLTPGGLFPCCLNGRRDRKEVISSCFHCHPKRITGQCWWNDRVSTARLKALADNFRWICRLVGTDESRNGQTKYGTSVLGWWLYPMSMYSEPCLHLSQFLNIIGGPWPSTV